MQCAVVVQEAEGCAAANPLHLVPVCRSNENVSSFVLEAASPKDAAIYCIASTFVLLK
jgi:hypothetical protein